ncbi:alpha/beta fold hydrolase [Mucilaginibacter psychrotolerans]|uniref:Alpha/beta hydrolase n=1 Tax=Mucilaginibacter psychrotolerans TaxID=1524096 RepID=A0A4Y8SCJ2_9SPHI|nr:alpha/beta hydrolase [Mucilaginibacter psychrotolerans]TFF36688.1 alpha/beta hydrolase [Mucilaginibacter psychrotolerans]
MKKLKQILAQVKAANDTDPAYIDLLWQLICYSPKMPLRLLQQQMLDEAERFTLSTYDEHFTHTDLTFNGFIWGSGGRTIMITHGWGSKAADFMELIAALREIPDTNIIAFDVPGNGSSEAELSNGALFSGAAEAVIAEYGMPDVLIGHSMGGMANTVALNSFAARPHLLISITPLIRLKENFENSMTAVGVAPAWQQAYLESFTELVGRPASDYDLDKFYQFDAELAHLLLYDDVDLISPYPFMHDFLEKRPFIQSQNFPGAGHERIIKSPEVIALIIAKINAILE